TVRGRRVLTAMLCAVAAQRGQAELAMPAYLAARLLDDLSYGAGVWRGCLRERSVVALLPLLHQWPGRARRSR
ncbi:MAG: mycofactocin biosynthesis glycosyltransferase MftF, partial [Sciscionella sp.]